MKDVSGVLMIALLFLLLGGCNLEELDFDKLSKNVDVHPTFIAPVAKGSVAVWDFINAANQENDNSLTKDANGLIKIIYKQDNLFNYNISELLDFPVSNSFSSGNQVLGDISIENVNVNRPINLQELLSKGNGLSDLITPYNGMTVPFPPLSEPNMYAHFTLEDISDFKTITLSKGNLKVSIDNKLKIPITIHGSLFDITNNQAVADFSFPEIAPQAIQDMNFNMEGKDLSNKLEFRLLSLETPGSATPIKIDMNDYFTMAFNFTDLGISKGNVKIAKTQQLEGSKGNFEFDFPEQDMKAFGAYLKKGALTIKSVSNLPLTGTIHFTLPEIKNRTTGLAVSADIPMNGTLTTIPLDNTIINLSSDPEKPFNRIPYSYTLTINQSSGYIDYSSSNAITLNVALDNLDFQTVAGDFGKRTIKIDPSKFSLDVEMLDKIKGDFKLDNPTMMLTVRNSVGVPATVAFDFIASNKEGKTLSMNAPVFDIPVPESLFSGVATKNVVFNKSNSNIVDFISLPPTGDISYSGTVNFNPTATVSLQNPNFLDMSAVFGVDLSMELPMELKINNLQFKDTSAISGADFKNIDNVELILNAKNEIPLDMDIQLLFVDTLSGKQLGATKVTRILSAAQVGASNTISAVESSHTFAIENTEMEQLRLANGIVFSGTVSSPNAGTTVAPIISTSKIEMNVVVKSKVNLNF